MPTRQLPPPPPPVVDPPPPPPPMTSGSGTQAIGVEVIAPALPPGDTQIGRTGLSDGDALPVVKVRPIYPNRARQQGLEGYVLVVFTIDELGRVVDARVVDAKPRGVFDHAALEAVARFRYKPRVVNGQATAVSGVEHLITFKLES